MGLLLPGVIISFGAFLAWVKLYPEDYDPKNIEYVLWTYGLNQNMNLDDAVPRDDPRQQDRPSGQRYVERTAQKPFRLHSHSGCNNAILSRLQ